MYVFMYNHDIKMRMMTMLCLSFVVDPYIYLYIYVCIYIHIYSIIIDISRDLECQVSELIKYAH